MTGLLVINIKFAIGIAVFLGIISNSGFSFALETLQIKKTKHFSVRNRLSPPLFFNQKYQNLDLLSGAC